MTEYTRREFLGLALLGGASGLLGACAKSSGRYVNFFNWSTYIAKDTLPRFTARTGVQVNYEVFADEEEMFAKLRSGAMGYDLVVGADVMLPRLKGMGLIDRIPPGALKNVGNIEEKFRRPPYDPELAYTVPYLWGTTGIGYNKRKVSQPPTSWHDLWDERYKGKISMLDNLRDCISTGLLLKGYPETTTDKKAFQEVKELLLKQRPLVRQYSSATYVDSLISGETHLAMAWSGDILQASRENPDLDYVIPKEGSYMWVDNLCLIKDAPHREEALALMDYLIEGETAAEIANFVRYASPNAAARPKLDKTLLADPRVFPPSAARLNFHALLDAEASALWSETWSDVKVL
jgi:spermidine/putrescine-binding protein